MVSTVKSRPNHYEVLGLSPGASDAEIAEAFAREIRAPRAFGGLAMVGLAYEVLRDPAKRRAYDESLGLSPEPRPAPSATVAGRGSAHFMGPAVGGLAWKPTVEAVEPHVTAQPRTETVPEPKAEPLVAASVREPELASERVEGPRQAQAAPSIEQLIGQLDAAKEAAERSSKAPQDRPVRWSRTAATAGALVVGTMLLGAWAGLEARDDEDALPVENSTSAKLPPPKPVAKSVVPSQASLGETPPQWAALHAPRRFAHAASPRQRPGSDDRLADIAQSLESAGPAEGTSVDAAAEAPPAQTVAASLPLPNTVVARTIERIGYACGEVASTSEGGAPGVYKVTCTSGHSYQAKSVRGRYHFRRLGSR